MIYIFDINKFFNVKSWKVINNLLFSILQEGTL